MPSSGEPQTVHRYPQSRPVTAVRWLLSPSPTLHRLLASAVDLPSPSLTIHSLTHDSGDRPQLQVLSSHPLPSPVTALRSPHFLPSAALGTTNGSLHLHFINPLDGSLDSHLSAPALHHGPVTGLDVQHDGRECVTVGEDGTIASAVVGEGRLESRRVHDSSGLAGYTTCRWASPTEFATGGIGFGIQWWDQRKPGGSVAQFKGNWSHEKFSGMVHSIDIHPSRKHICVAGGSSGLIFAWDLRWQQQPILLSLAGRTGITRPASESEVWEVQYDSFTRSSGINTAASARVLPVMMCSEDGILAVLQEGVDPLELLTESCAINSFDIDPQNPSEVVCALEWESIGILMRRAVSLPA